MVACDVTNPFYGPDGAAYIFAQQKGTDPKMVQRLDEGMQSLAEVIKKTTGKDITNYPGAGAARGMGGGLLAFFNAALKPGTELLLKAIDFSEKKKRSIIWNSIIIVIHSFLRKNKRSRPHYYGRGKSRPADSYGKSSIQDTKGSTKRTYPRYCTSRQYRKPAGIKQSGIQRYILYSPRPHHPGEGNGTGVC